MEYKRTESFRHVLLQPVDVEYTCKINQVAVTVIGKIIDISPNGISILTKEELPKRALDEIFHFSFVLFNKTIEAEGIIRWKKIHHEGYRYGVELHESPATEQLIIDELKLRRRKEVLDAKEQ